MKKIIVFGSLNMDLSIRSPSIPHQGETIEGDDFFRAAGGKGGNQAVAAAKLGAETHMLAKVGSDLFGRELVQSLHDAGVNCRHLLQNGVSSGVAVILRTAGDNRIICDYGANHEVTFDEMKDALSQIAEPGDLFITQLECEPNVTYQLLRFAKTMNLITIFNPAPARVLPLDLYSRIDYLVVNQTECQILTGILPESPSACREPLTMFRERGVAEPIITLGELGSAALQDRKEFFIPSIPVTPVDTTAAGDAYIGALSAALLRGEPLEDALSFATKAAAITITRSGAQQSVPTIQEMLEAKLMKEDDL